MGKRVPVTEESAFSILKEYQWPGNVRELQNIVQRLLLRDENIITPEIIKEALSLHPATPQQMSNDAVLQFDAQGTTLLHEMEDIFRKKYFSYIRKHAQSDADAARKLGLAPPNYHRMCKELGIKS